MFSHFPYFSLMNYFHHGTKLFQFSLSNPSRSNSVFLWRFSHIQSSPSKITKTAVFLQPNREGIKLYPSLLSLRGKKILICIYFSIKGIAIDLAFNQQKLLHFFNQIIIKVAVKKRVTQELEFLLQTFKIATIHLTHFFPFPYWSKNKEKLHDYSLTCDVNCQSKPFIIRLASHSFLKNILLPPFQVQYLSTTIKIYSSN